MSVVLYKNYVAGTFNHLAREAGLNEMVKAPEIIKIIENEFPNMGAIPDDDLDQLMTVYGPEEDIKKFKNRVRPLGWMVEPIINHEIKFAGAIEGLFDNTAFDGIKIRESQGSEGRLLIADIAQEDLPQFNKILSASGIIAVSIPARDCANENTRPKSSALVLAA